ncbi:MAG: hypothetical protein GWP17_01870 [Aquificales bacterium]|nr:hypothetical protein [Aquificales bacterium]
MPPSRQIKRREIGGAEWGQQYESSEGMNGRLRRYGDMVWRLVRRDGATRREIGLKNWLASGG